MSCLYWMLKMLCAKNMQYTCKLNLLKWFSNCFNCLYTSKLIHIYFLANQSFFMPGTSLFFSLDTILFKNVKILQYLHFMQTQLSRVIPFVILHCQRDFIPYNRSLWQYFIPSFLEFLIDFFSVHHSKKAITASICLLLT